MHNAVNKNKKLYSFYIILQFVLIDNYLCEKVSIELP